MNHRLSTLVRVASLLGLSGCSILGYREITPGPATGQATESSASEQMEPAERWASVLRRHVRDEGVNYETLVLDRDLPTLVSALGESGPTRTPERFADDASRLAFWINAYNSLVLMGVTDNWPIGSVQDVHGAIEPTAGFGFFYGLHFRVDGRSINLYDLENEFIRAPGDARIHAAINCASRSCPALSPRPFRPATLDAQLDEAIIAFCSHAPHVIIDENRQKIGLSSIFDWYADDFKNHAAREHFALRTESPEVMDFILHFAEPQMAERLRAALRAGYEQEYRDYDWSLNSSSR